MVQHEKTTLQPRLVSAMPHTLPLPNQKFIRHRCVPFFWAITLTGLVLLQVSNQGVYLGGRLQVVRSLFLPLMSLLGAGILFFRAEAARKAQRAGIVHSLLRPLGASGLYTTC